MALVEKANSALRVAGRATWFLVFAGIVLFDRLEGLLVIAAGIVFLLSAERPLGLFDRAESFFSRLSRRKTFCVIALGLAVILVRLAVLPILPIPAPIVHDEFSYLFAADTFASGRLTNPTHPMWIHFETFHISHTPTTFSKYFPAQGIFLALGQWVFGHPWYGVLLSVALMSAAVLWMLQQWFPPRWALLGASLLAIRLGTTSYWVNSYWGGAVAALGGALVWGATPGVLAGRRARYSVILGIGLVILANSRPLEGAIVSLPVAVVLVMKLFRLPSGERRPWLLRAMAPMTVLLVMGAAAITQYNRAVTGDPLLPPHIAYDRQYSTTDYFLGAEIRGARDYNHQVLRDFFVDYTQEAAGSMKTVLGWTIRRLTNFFTSAEFFIGAVFMIPIAAAPAAFRDRRIRLPVCALVFFFLFLNLEVHPQPHYLAPALGLMCAFGLQCTRHLGLWTEGAKPTGKALLRAVSVLPAAAVVLYVGSVAAGAQKDRPFALHDRWLVTYADHPLVQREQIEEELSRQGGKHLVVVRYGTDHDFSDEWVYNRSDIDGAPVIWAREMDSERNQKLFDYFRERSIWLLEPDRDPIDPRPYPR